MGSAEGSAVGERRGDLHNFGTYNVRGSSLLAAYLRHIVAWVAGSLPFAQNRAGRVRSHASQAAEQAQREACHGLQPSGPRLRAGVDGRRWRLR